MLKNKLKRGICGKKQLLFCLLKKNTYEKQLPHSYLCFKLKCNFCMFFFFCVCAVIMKYSIFRVSCGQK